MNAAPRRKRRSQVGVRSNSAIERRWARRDARGSGTDGPGALPFRELAGRTVSPAVRHLIDSRTAFDLDRMRYRVGQTFQSRSGGLAEAMLLHSATRSGADYPEVRRILLAEMESLVDQGRVVMGTGQSARDYNVVRGMRRPIPTPAHATAEMRA